MSVVGYPTRAGRLVASGHKFSWSARPEGTCNSCSRWPPRGIDWTTHGSRSPARTWRICSPTSIRSWHTDRPTRSLRNLIRNLPFAWRTIRRLDPDVILSTGAGVAVPFFLVGKLLHRRLVYVESVTRTQSVSLSGRLVYPLADEFFVQWPQAANGRRMRYAGRVL
jgi:Oligosaccharide biosynthesis protein Alg14 like